jgi:acetoin utilization deacetylase AcuC-like enzyme
VGGGAGAGFTVNLALDAGAGDADFDEAFRRVAVPVLDAFAPELVLVSAGFDAHEADPLGGMRMTAAGFAALGGLLRGVAGRHAGGRLVAVTEGGYDLDALSSSLDALLGVLGGAAPPVAVAGDRSRGGRSAAAARAALGRYWPGL